MRISCFAIAIAFCSVPTFAQVMTSRTPPRVFNEANNNAQWTLDYDALRSGTFNANGYALTKSELKALRELEKQTAAGNLVKARAALTAAEVAVVSDDSKYVLGALQLQLADKANDNAMRAKATDRVLAARKAPAAMLPALYKNQGMFALEQNDLPKADRAFTRLVELMPSNPEAIIILAQVKSNEGKFAEALPLFDRAIAAKKASGQPVPEIWGQVASQMRTKVAR